MSTIGWLLLICLFRTGVKAQESPCPRLFEYVRDGNQWSGIVQIPSSNFGTSISLVLEMSLGAQLPNNNVGNIQLVGSQDEVEKTIRNGGVVTYKVHFPLVSPIPKITSILINDKEYCVGPPETFSDDVRFITTIKLEYSLSFNREDSGVEPNIQQYDNYSTTTRTTPHLYSSQSPTRPDIPKVTPRPDVQYQPSSVETATTEQIDDFEESCGMVDTKPNALIVGGSETKPGDWPWLSAIYFDAGKKGLDFLCSGTLISRTEIITAAHCVLERNNRLRKLIIKLGIYNIFEWSDPNQIIRTQKTIHPHPEYDRTYLHNDIAIIKIERVEYTKFIKPVCVWNLDKRLSEIIKSKGTVVGWGRNENSSVTPELSLAKAEIVSTDTCRDKDKRLIPYTSNKTMCAGNKDGTGPCTGDSGGGLYLFRNGRWHIRGVVSHSMADMDTKKICENRDYVVYTDTAQYTSWIKTIQNG